MMEILVATANPHKVEEISALLPRDLPVKFLALTDFPHIKLPPETGSTLEANAELKARAAAKASGHWALADDTGLEVDALNGAPGVYSARYAGKERDYPANNTKLLKEMVQVPPEKRTARFRCVVAIASPQGELLLAEGKLEGRIATKATGSNGFGYDPLFIPQGRDITLAQLSFEEKNGISHRADSLQKAAGIIRRLADKYK